MKYLADENIEKPIVDWLRDKGEDVYYVPEEFPSLKDSEIVSIAKEENRGLVRNFSETFPENRVEFTPVLSSRPQ